MKLQGIALKNLLSIVKHYEGCKLEPYMDENAVWTEGIGHAMLDDKNHQIKGIENKNLAFKYRKVHTQEDADALCIKDLEESESQVNALGLIINDNQKASIIDFAYQEGIARLKESKLLGYIKKGSKPEVIDAGFLGWTAVNGKPCAGVKARRQTESLLYRTGELKFFN